MPAFASQLRRLPELGEFGYPAAATLQRSSSACEFSRPPKHFSIKKDERREQADGHQGRRTLDRQGRQCETVPVWPAEPPQAFRRDAGHFARKLPAEELRARLLHSLELLPLELLRSIRAALSRLKANGAAPARIARAKLWAHSFVDSNENKTRKTFRARVSFRARSISLDGLPRIGRGCLHELAPPFAYGAPSSSAAFGPAAGARRLHGLGMPANPGIVHAGSRQNTRRLADRLRRYCLSTRCLAAPVSLNATEPEPRSPLGRLSPGFRRGRHSEHKTLISLTFGGSDGARTHDLRRDRRHNFPAFSTGVPTFRYGKTTGFSIEVGTTNLPGLA